MKYVLDTNTLIYFFKGLGKTADHLLTKPPNEIGIPAIVLYELEVGILKSKSPSRRKEQIEEFASLVNFIPFGYAEAKSAATIRVKLEKRGSPIGAYDVLIAASALANNWTLVTVVDRDAAWADALATALQVLGPQEGRALAARERLAARFVQRQKDGSFAEWSTLGFEAFVGLGGAAAPHPPDPPLAPRE